jgi:hypothetical protein
MNFELDGTVNPAGTIDLGLIDALIDLFKEQSVCDVEVNFISYKLDKKERLSWRAVRMSSRFDPLP